MFPFRSVFVVFSIYNTYYKKKLVRATCPKKIFLKILKNLRNTIDSHVNL